MIILVALVIVCNVWNSVNMSLENWKRRFRPLPAARLVALNLASQAEKSLHFVLKLFLFCSTARHIYITQIFDSLNKFHSAGDSDM